jgi:tRNA pseudouridine13 synthase
VNPIAPPRAHAKLLVEGVIRRCADDFYVDEQAAFEPNGEGEHLLLRIEKRGLNSVDVANDLARAFAVAPENVSFAGMKDRHAVTRQWFSVCTPRAARSIEAHSEAWRVIESARHRRKLRRGDLAGNAFRIRVHELRADVDALTERLELLRAHGAPNYFGEQRFGHDGANVERARAWICNRPRPAVPAFQKGLHLSTARALLFNAVLGHRVVAGNWDRLIDGDVALDARPTGPLWGRGRPAASGAAMAIETDALAVYREWLDPLEHLGLAQERRALTLLPLRLDWTIDPTVLEMSFELPPGQYATALLREMGTLHNAAAGAP